MSFVDELLNEVDAATKLDAGTKTLLREFLTSSRGFLENLGPQVAGDFFQALYLHGAAEAWDTLVGRLGQAELLELLRHTGAAMDEAADRRAQAVAEWHEMADALGLAILRIVTQLLVAAV